MGMSSTDYVNLLNAMNASQGQMAGAVAALGSVFPNYFGGDSSANALQMAQGQIMAASERIRQNKAEEERKKAEKQQKKGSVGSTIGGAVGTVGGIIAAPYTGGASLAVGPSLGASLGNMAAGGSGKGDTTSTDMMSQAGSSLASAYGAGNIKTDAPMFQAFGKFGQGGKTAQPGPTPPKYDPKANAYFSGYGAKRKTADYRYLEDDDQFDAIHQAYGGTYPRRYI